MIELVLSVVLAIIGFLIGGFIGEHSYMNYSPYCWYGAVIGFLVIWICKFISHFDSLFEIFD